MAADALTICLALPLMAYPLALTLQ